MSLEKVIASIDHEIELAQEYINRLERGKAELTSRKAKAEGPPAATVERVRKTRRKRATTAKPSSTRDSEAVIRQYLEGLGGNGATAGEIAQSTGLKRNSVSTKLTQMAKAGKITKVDRGYTL